MNKNSGDMCKLRMLTRTICKGSERVSDRKTGGWFVWLQMGSTVHTWAAWSTPAVPVRHYADEDKHTHAGEQCVCAGAVSRTRRRRRVEECLFACACACCLSLGCRVEADLPEARIRQRLGRQRHQWETRDMKVKNQGTDCCCTSVRGEIKPRGLDRRRTWNLSHYSQLPWPAPPPPVFAPLHARSTAP